MIRSVVTLTMAMLVVGSTVFGQATKKQSTIIGDVVDIKSYIVSGMKADNPDRKAVAEASMKSGNPLGVLEKKTGKIYIVVMGQQGSNANETLKDYLGLHVFVKGVVYKKAGMQLIVLSDIGKSVK